MGKKKDKKKDENEFLDYVRGELKKVGVKFSNGSERAVDWAKDVASDVKDYVEDVGPVAKEEGKKVIKATGQWAKSTWQNIKDTPYNPPEKTKGIEQYRDYHVSLNSTGWYYDAQLNNEMQSVSLHANQRYKPKFNEDGTSIDTSWTQPIDPDQVGKGEKEYEGLEEKFGKYNEAYDDWENWPQYLCDDDTYTPNFSEDTNVCGYRIEPICKSLFYEDFVVNTANSWSDFGSDAVGSLWDAMRNTAPFSSFLSGALSSMSGTLAARGYQSKFATGVQKVLDFAAEGTRRMSNYQNKSLVVTGTQMSLFSGTGIDFSNLGLRLTLFPELTENGYKTVTEQVEELYPYLIGIYKADRSLSELVYKVANGLNKKKDSGEVLTYDMSSYIGWNNPPGGYKANSHLLDCIHQGTLKLRIGAQYCIPNLVCQSATFAFSRQMVKLPTPGNPERLSISPLYCEVSIILRPMSRYTNRILNEYISSRGQFGTTQRKRQLEANINANLRNLQKKEDKLTKNE